jgi:hypothetical protein
MKAGNIHPVRIAFDIPVIPHGRTHFMAKVRLIS